ncbi:hypothetical protein RJ641_002110 [Dillenia turbinata]|uniref:F-box domain-containing protein n=1 Tax=Dillenia turbinata TaxID=194707 RepID=A0AAN8VMT2_9MAGN
MASRELGFVRYLRSFGRKRIVISNNVEEGSIDCDSSPLKRQCSLNLKDGDLGISFLENLPQEILIRILCGVDHEDLKQLIHVSKSVRDATLIAKECHFAYGTPSKKSVFRCSMDLEECGESDEVEAPNAPKQARARKSRLTGKKLSEISVKLFASAVED